MKVTVKGSMNPENLIDIAEKIILKMMQDKYNDKVLKGGIRSSSIYLEDPYYSASCGVNFEKEVITFWSKTISGTFHALDFNLEKGEIKAYHIGKRNSTFCLLSEFLPNEWIEFCKGEKTEWEIIEYETSEKNWAAYCMIIFKVFGTGPCCQQQFLADEQRRIQTLVQDQFNMINKPFPNNTDYDSIEKKWFDYDKQSYIKFPDWTPLDRVRANAIGLKLWTGSEA